MKLKPKVEMNNNYTCWSNIVVLTIIVVLFCDPNVTYITAHLPPCLSAFDFLCYVRVMYKIGVPALTILSMRLFKLAPK